MASSSSSIASEPQLTIVDGGLDEEFALTVKWSGKEYTVLLSGDDTLGELKKRICEVTTVLPKRQKLLYPKLSAKLGDDSILLSDLRLKPSVKMTMIGSDLDRQPYLYIPNSFCLLLIHVF